MNNEGSWTSPNLIAKLLIAMIAYCAVLPAFAAEPSTQPTTAPDPLADGTVYEDLEHGFKLIVPREWRSSSEPFTMTHYRDVFLVIGSRRGNLKITEKEVAPGHWQLDSGIALMQMRPGEVYLDIAHFDGPGGSAPTTQGDEVGADLIAQVDAASFAPTDARGLSAMNLSFRKRGHSWDIQAYLSEPINADDRATVFSILKSLRFVDTPVMDDEWAALLAFRALPPQIQHPNEDIRAGVAQSWVLPQGSAGDHQVRTVRRGASYEVTFTYGGAGEWKFSVARDGTVKQISP